MVPTRRTEIRSPPSMENSSPRRVADLAAVPSGRTLEEIDSRKKSRIKWIVLAVVAGVAAFAFWRFGDVLTIDSLAAREGSLREFQLARPLLFATVAVLVYVVTAALSLPGAAILTIAFGWLFGFREGTILVSFSSTLGATLAFLFSRFVFRDAIRRKFGERIQAINDSFEREGAFYLFTLRLVPAVPFFVINLVMGLTPIRTWTFWWVSQLGMLGGTAVYVYAGAAVPTLNELAERGLKGIASPQVIVAFALLGIFPLIAKKVITRLKAKRQAA